MQTEIDFANITLADVMAIDREIMDVAMARDAELAWRYRRAAGFTAQSLEDYPGPISADD